MSENPATEDLGDSLVQWPEPRSPHVTCSNAPPSAESRREPVFADGDHLIVGKYRLPLSDLTVQFSSWKPLILQGGGHRLNLRVFSWINGSFDNQHTLLLGAFCRAAQDRDRTRMTWIASEIRRIRTLETRGIFLSFLILLGAAFCIVFASDDSAPPFTKSVSPPLWVFYPVLAMAFSPLLIGNRKRRNLIKRLGLKDRLNWRAILGPSN